MIFFLKADGTLIKSAPDTVYQGSAEAGKIYVVAPLNAGMLVDVYYELPNGERWGAYLLENNGKVIDDADLPEGWALWSTSLASAITQYAGTLKAQFGFYQSGTADKVPLITSQAVAITIAKGVVRDLPEAPTTDVYEQILNALSSIKQDIANLPNEYLANTNEDKIALKNNSAIEYSENATAGTIVKRDINGKINVVDGTEDLNAVNVRQFNAALAGKVDASSISSAAVKDTIAQRTSTGQLKASDGVADDDLATVKQLNAAQGNYTDITNIDLNTGDTTVEYDTELGITVNAKGTVTHKNGNAEQPTTKFELPIVSGDGIVIDKAQNEEKISVKVDGKVTKTPNSIVKRDSAGRVKTADAVSDEDAASYGQQKALRNYTDSELLKKLDRTGGTITGNLIVSGNLSVSGETSVIESTTLKVSDKLIYVAKDNTSALTSPAGLITPKYDGTNDGGLVYDNSGTAYVGDIKLDSNGNVDVNNSDLQPIATRDAYSNFTNGHKVKAEVDSSQKSVKFIDGGKDDGINSLINADLTFSDTTVQYDTTDGIQLISTGRFAYAGGNHDATIDLDLPIVGKDGIVIDKAADSEKIEVSGKNLIKDPLPGKNTTGAQVVPVKNFDGDIWVTAFKRNSANLVVHANSFDFVGYGHQGEIYSNKTTDNDYSVVNKKYADGHYVKSNSAEITDPSPDVIQLLPNGYYTLTEKDTTGFTNNLKSSYYTIAMFKFSASEGCAIAQDVTKNKMYVASFSSSTGTKGWNEIPNMTYLEDNYVKKPEPYVVDSLIAIHANGNIFVKHIDDLGSVPDTIAQVYTNDAGDHKPYSNGALITNEPVKPYQCANKKYVDDLIDSISPTMQTKYQHNLRLEGTKDGCTFTVFMSLMRNDDTTITDLDEVISILGSSYQSCTGYIYDGNQKSYNVIAFDSSGSIFVYNDPETGGQVFAVTNDDVAISDDPIIEF